MLLVADYLTNNHMWNFQDNNESIHDVPIKECYTTAEQSYFVLASEWRETRRPQRKFPRFPALKLVLETDHECFIVTCFLFLNIFFESFLSSKPKNMNNVLGSIGSPNFRIDVIFNSLRELQQG